MTFKEYQEMHEGKKRKKLLVPLRSKDERSKNFNVAIHQRMKVYNDIRGRNRAHLDLSKTPIISLPDNTKKVGKDLDLSNSNIKKLPSGLKVGRSLHLSNTPITSLPDDLKVGKDLNLLGSSIESLPDNFKIKGSLHLSNTPITSLPRGLNVNNLFLNNTKITSLPRDCKVSILHINNDNFALNGLKVDSLYLSNISSIPSNLEVNYLSCYECKFTSLPRNVKIKKGLSFNFMTIESLPDNLKLEWLDFTGTTLKTLPLNLQVDDLNLIGHTEIKFLPSGLKVGKLDLRGSSVISIPRDLEAKELRVRNTPFAEKYTENEMYYMLPNVKKIKH